MSISYLASILMDLAFRAPVLIVLLTGIVLSLVWMKRYPEVSILACIAFLLFSMTSVAGIITHSLAPILMDQFSFRLVDYNTLSISINIINSIINLAAWVLVLMAIFRQRNQIVDSKPGSSETITNLPA